MTDLIPMTLGELVTLQRGHDLPEGKRTAGPVPVMGSFGITGSHDIAKAKGPGVTVGRSGASIGVVSYTEDDYWPLNTCMYVTDFKGNDPRFVYYFLQTVNLAAHNSGSAQPSLNRNYIYPIDIAVPRPADQREIAALLGALDDKIELNRRMSATLEEMARALYRSWFVDFDPVHARALGQPPAHMDATTAALFPDSVGPDRLPTGWKAGTLGDLIEFNPKERLPKGKSAPYLEMKALPTSGMSADIPYFREFTSGTKFREKDTLLARITPCLENGKTMVVDDLLGAEVGWGSTEFIVMRAKSGVSAALPYCVARDPDFRAEAIQTMTGSSGRQRADAKRISELGIAIAPPEVHTAYSDLVSPMLDRVIAAGQEARKLAELRDVMLPRLLSGELRIREAEEHVEEFV